MSGPARRRVVVGLLAGCVVSPLTAAPPQLADQVRRRLSDAPVLRGQFEQRKTVRGFKHALVSRGDFLVAKERGVVWHTREPFESSLVVTRERLLSRRADGRPEQRIETRDEPVLRAVNEMLFALMSADLATLGSRFQIDGELVGAGGWRLALVPRDSALAHWVARIEIEGDSHVRGLRLQEAQGDTSVIRFNDQVQSMALTREEAARFE